MLSGNPSAGQSGARNHIRHSFGFPAHELLGNQHRQHYRVADRSMAHPFHDGHRGWSLHRSEPPNLLKFLHVGYWAVIGAGPETNALFNEIRDRIQHYDDPFAAHSSTNWLEVDANLPVCQILLKGHGICPKVYHEFPSPLPVTGQRSDSRKTDFP